MFTLEHLIDGCTCHGKTCSKCRKKKCYRAFACDKRKSDGLHGHCRICRSKVYAKHRQAYPEHQRISKHNARARKKKAVATLTVQQWLDLKALYNYRCLCCGKQEPDITLTLDHVIPISKCGGNGISNVQPLCLTCNKKKGTKSIDFRPFRSRANQEVF